MAISGAKRWGITAGMAGVGFLSAYVISNWAEEDKSGEALFSPHHNLGLYGIDAAAGIVCGAIALCLTSFCGADRRRQGAQHQRLSEESQEQQQRAQFGAKYHSTDASQQRLIDSSTMPISNPDRLTVIV